MCFWCLGELSISLKVSNKTRIFLSKMQDVQNLQLHCIWIISPKHIDSMLELHYGPLVDELYKSAAVPPAQMGQRVISTNSSKIARFKNGCLIEYKINLLINMRLHLHQSHFLHSVTWKSLVRTRVQSVARGGPLCIMVIENKEGPNLMLLK